tara:strand:+ start:19798 stop:20406 length:609 start_codon:yes stop_codon:yes gene_type:complete
MDVLSWVSIFTIITILIGLASTLKITFSIKSAYLVLLTLALVSYLGSNIIYVIDTGLSTSIKWLNLITLCFLLSSQFGLIRDSQPVFARFPIYLIYLPFILLFFFPLIVSQNVLTNLLIGTLQGGCITVALLMYGIHQFREGHYIWQLSSSILFLISFIIFWFADFVERIEIISAEILIAFGIILLTTGIYTSNKNKLNVKS